MNPIIFFDEVDKISKTEKGLELENLLINIIDITQNYNFFDKYLQELQIDLSKILFIFSYNHSDCINPILKDRIYEINIPKYNNTDKLNIATKFIIPDLLNQYSFSENDLKFNKNSISYIISNLCSSDEGVRNLKHILNNIISKNSHYICNQKIIQLLILIHLIKYNSL